MNTTAQMNNTQKDKDTAMEEKTGKMNVKLNTIMSLEKKMFTTQRKFYFLFVSFIIITVATVAIKIYNPVQKQPLVMKKTFIRQELVRRSKVSGVIQRGLTGNAIDVNTGKIVKAARVFSSVDKTVYLELDLNNPPKGTVIDYIRYKDGGYIDHGEVTLTKANINNLLFNWKINKLLTNVRDGKYKIATYADGILAKRIVYEVTHNNVSYVYPNQPISSNDSDYTLKDTLSFVSKGN